MATSPDRTLLRRQEIVDAAVEIADRDGLESVSMRYLAERLGVGTMTLYSYVSDKDELFDLMLDEVSREMLVGEPLPPTWREALRAIALRTRDAIDHHPWIFDTTARRPRRRIHSMRHIEESLAAVAPLGVDGASAGAILMAVDDYTVGHAFRKHARLKLARHLRAAAARGEEVRTPADPAVDAALEAGELPLLARGVDGGGARGMRPRAGLPPEADFERGLDWLLDGIEARLGERARADG